MNKLVITGINFKYDDGHDKRYTHVDINFISQGTPFSLSGKVTVNRNEYDANSENTEALKNLVLIKVNQEYGKQLAE